LCKRAWNTGATTQEKRKAGPKNFSEGGKNTREREATIHQSFRKGARKRSKPH